MLVKAANTFAHMAADGTDGGYRGDLLDSDSLQAQSLTEAQHAEVLDACSEAATAN
ncbi:MAG: hypothetical protein ABIP94_20610 [Planctomycetota bacterium]